MSSLDHIRVELEAIFSAVKAISQQISAARQEADVREAEKTLQTQSVKRLEIKIKWLEIKNSHEKDPDFETIQSYLDKLDIFIGKVKEKLQRARDLGFIGIESDESEILSEQNVRKVFSRELADVSEQQSPNFEVAEHDPTDENVWMETSVKSVLSIEELAAALKRALDERSAKKAEEDVYRDEDVEEESEDEEPINYLPRIIDLRYAYQTANFTPQQVENLRKFSEIEGYQRLYTLVTQTTEPTAEEVDEVGFSEYWDDMEFSAAEALMIRGLMQQEILTLQTLVATESTAQPWDAYLQEQLERIQTNVDLELLYTQRSAVQPLIQYFKSSPDEAQVAESSAAEPEANSDSMAVASSVVQDQDESHFLLTQANIEAADNLAELCTQLGIHKFEDKIKEIRRLLTSGNERDTASALEEIAILHASIALEIKAEIYQLLAEHRDVELSQIFTPDEYALWQNVLNKTDVKNYFRENNISAHVVVEMQTKLKQTVKITSAWLTIINSVKEELAKRVNDLTATLLTQQQNATTPSLALYQQIEDIVKKAEPAQATSFLKHFLQSYFFARVNTLEQNPEQAFILSQEFGWILNNLLSNNESIKKLISTDPSLREVMVSALKKYQSAGERVTRKVKSMQFIHMQQQQLLPFTQAPYYFPIEYDFEKQIKKKQFNQIVALAQRDQKYEILLQYNFKRSLNKTHVKEIVDYIESTYESHPGSRSQGRYDLLEMLMRRSDVLAIVAKDASLQTSVQSIRRQAIKEMGEALTQLEYHLTCGISPRFIFEINSSNGTRANFSPWTNNIEFFERLKNFVKLSIVAEKDSNIRHLRANFWLQLAKYCYDTGAGNSALYIYSALTHVQVLNLLEIKTLESSPEVGIDALATDAAPLAADTLNSSLYRQLIDSDLPRHAVIALATLDQLFASTQEYKAYQNYAEQRRAQSLPVAPLVAAVSSTAMKAFEGGNNAVQAANILEKNWSNFVYQSAEELEPDLAKVLQGANPMLHPLMSRSDAEKKKPLKYDPSDLHQVKVLTGELRYLDNFFRGITAATETVSNFSLMSLFPSLQEIVGKLPPSKATYLEYNGTNDIEGLFDDIIKKLSKQILPNEKKGDMKYAKSQLAVHPVIKAISDGEWHNQETVTMQKLPEQMLQLHKEQFTVYAAVWLQQRVMNFAIKPEMSEFYRLLNTNKNLVTFFEEPKKFYQDYLTNVLRLVALHENIILDADGNMQYETAKELDEKVEAYLMGLPEQKTNQLRWFFHRNPDYYTTLLKNITHRSINSSNLEIVDCIANLGFTESSEQIILTLLVESLPNFPQQLEFMADDQNKQLKLIGELKAQRAKNITYFAENLLSSFTTLLQDKMGVLPTQIDVSTIPVAQKAVVHLIALVRGTINSNPEILAEVASQWLSILGYFLVQAKTGNILATILAQAVVTAFDTPTYDQLNTLLTKHFPEFEIKEWKAIGLLNSLLPAEIASLKMMGSDSDLKGNKYQEIIEEIMMNFYSDRFDAYIDFAKKGEQGGLSKISKWEFRAGVSKDKLSLPEPKSINLTGLNQILAAPVGIIHILDKTLVSDNVGQQFAEVITHLQSESQEFLDEQSQKEKLQEVCAALLSKWDIVTEENANAFFQDVKVQLLAFAVYILQAEKKELFVERISSSINRYLDTHKRDREAIFAEPESVPLSQFYLGWSKKFVNIMANNDYFLTFLAEVGNPTDDAYQNLLLDYQALIESKMEPQAFLEKVRNYIETSGGAAESKSAAQMKLESILSASTPGRVVFKSGEKLLILNIHSCICYAQELDAFSKGGSGAVYRGYRYKNNLVELFENPRHLLSLQQSSTDNWQEVVVKAIVNPAMPENLAVDTNREILINQKMGFHPEWITPRVFLVDNAGEASLQERLSHISSANITQLSNQIMRAVLDMHLQKGICSLDLKPQNIVMGKENTSVRIIDYGLATDSTLASFIDQSKEAEILANLRLLAKNYMFNPEKEMQLQLKEGKSLADMRQALADLTYGEARWGQVVSEYMTEKAEDDWQLYITQMERALVMREFSAGALIKPLHQQLSSEARSRAIGLTPKFAPPEALRAISSDEPLLEQASAKMDVFSLGRTLSCLEFMRKDAINQPGTIPKVFSTEGRDVDVAVALTCNEQNKDELDKLKKRKQAYLNAGKKEDADRIALIIKMVQFNPNNRISSLELARKLSFTEANLERLQAELQQAKKYKDRDAIDVAEQDAVESETPDPVILAVIAAYREQEASRDSSRIKEKLTGVVDSLNEATEVNSVDFTTQKRALAAVRDTYYQAQAIEFFYPMGDKTQAGYIFTQDVRFDTLQTLLRMIDYAEGAILIAQHCDADEITKKELVKHIMHVVNSYTHELLAQSTDTVEAVKASVEQFKKCTAELAYLVRNHTKPAGLVEVEQHHKNDPQVKSWQKAYDNGYAVFEDLRLAAGLVAMERGYHTIASVTEEENEELFISVSKPVSLQVRAFDDIKADPAYQKFVANHGTWLAHAYAQNSAVYSSTPFPTSLREMGAANIRQEQAWLVHANDTPELLFENIRTGFISPKDLRDDRLREEAAAKNFLDLIEMHSTKIQQAYASTFGQWLENSEAVIPILYQTLVTPNEKEKSGVVSKIIARKFFHEENGIYLGGKFIGWDSEAELIQAKMQAYTQVFNEFHNQKKIGDFTTQVFTDNLAISTRQKLDGLIENKENTLELIRFQADLLLRLKSSPKFVDSLGLNEAQRTQLQQTLDGIKNVLLQDDNFVDIFTAQQHLGDLHQLIYAPIADNIPKTAQERGLIDLFVGIQSAIYLKALLIEDRVADITLFSQQAELKKLDLPSEYQGLEGNKRFLCAVYEQLMLYGMKGMLMASCKSSFDRFGVTLTYTTALREMAYKTNGWLLAPQDKLQLQREASVPYQTQRANFHRHFEKLIKLGHAHQVGADNNSTAALKSGELSDSKKLTNKVLETRKKEEKAEVKKEKMLSKLRKDGFGKEYFAKLRQDKGQLSSVTAVEQLQLDAIIKEIASLMERRGPIDKTRSNLPSVEEAEQRASLQESIRAIKQLIAKPITGVTDGNFTYAFNNLQELVNAYVSERAVVSAKIQENTISVFSSDTAYHTAQVLKDLSDYAQGALFIVQYSNDSNLEKIMMANRVLAITSSYAERLLSLENNPSIKGKKERATLFSQYLAELAYVVDKQTRPSGLPVYEAEKWVKKARQTGIDYNHHTDPQWRIWQTAYNSGQAAVDGLHFAVRLVRAKHGQNLVANVVEDEQGRFLLKLVSSVGNTSGEVLNIEQLKQNHGPWLTNADSKENVGKLSARSQGIAQTWEVEPPKKDKGPETGWSFRKLKDRKTKPAATQISKSHFAALTTAKQVTQETKATKDETPVVEHLLWRLRAIEHHLVNPKINGHLSFWHGPMVAQLAAVEAFIKQAIADENTSAKILQQAEDALRLAEQIINDFARHNSIALIEHTLTSQDNREANLQILRRTTTALLSKLKNTNLTESSWYQAAQQAQERMEAYLHTDNATVIDSNASLYEQLFFLCDKDFLRINLSGLMRIEINSLPESFTLTGAHSASHTMAEWYYQLVEYYYQSGHSQTPAQQVEILDEVMSKVFNFLLRILTLHQNPFDMVAKTTVQPNHFKKDIRAELSTLLKHWQGLYRYKQETLGGAGQMKNFAALFPQDTDILNLPELDLINSLNPEYKEKIVASKIFTQPSIDGSCGAEERRRVGEESNLPLRRIVH